MLLTTGNEVQPETPLAILNFIISFGGDMFQNLRISIKIVLIVAVLLESCQRFFSKLKLILSCLRA